MSSNSHSSRTIPGRDPTLDPFPSASIHPSLPSQQSQDQRRPERESQKRGYPAEEDQPNRKRGRVDESLFPWNAQKSTRRRDPSLEQEQVLKLLRSWAHDPAYVVRKIIFASNCPEFPNDEWLNIVMGFPVDLDKVLETIIARPKAWAVAFRRTTDATVFAIPQRSTEYDNWYFYMSNLFAATQPSFHHKVIDFDKAVRIRVGNQKAIRLTEYSAFDDLRIMHLSDFGMGFYSIEQTPNTGCKAKRRTNVSGRRAPCHK